MSAVRMSAADIQSDDRKCPKCMSDRTIVAAALGGHHRVPIHAFDGRHVGWHDTYITFPEAEVMAESLVPVIARLYEERSRSAIKTAKALAWDEGYADAIRDSEADDYTSENPYWEADSDA
jgi:hypothetical protein